MRYSLLYISIALLALGACQKVDEDFFGAELAVASDDFEVTVPFQADRDSADFTIDSTSFAVTFNERVSWKLSIVGQSSRARRDYEGISTGFSFDEYIWDGKTNGSVSELDLFQRGELCIATLSVAGHDVSWSDTVKVIEGPDYGVLLSDFEQGASSIGPPWYAPGVEPGDGDVLTATVEENSNAPQGEGAVHINGIDNSANFYIGNFGYNNIVPMNVGTQDSSELWFNVYVKGNGDPSNSMKLQIQLSERDGDAFILEIRPTHSDWQLYSARYSDLIVPDGFPVGNDKHDVRLLQLVGFLVSSDPAGGDVEAWIDYPIFTVGGPLLK